jgi:hypothetical protein
MMTTEEKRDARAKRKAARDALVYARLERETDFTLTILRLIILDWIKARAMGEPPGKAKSRVQ